MLDIGVTKMAIIGVIALVFIGPEKLPSMAKTIGTLLGRARRYVADVKDEVNRSMELDELKKMKDSVENAAREVEGSIKTSTTEFEKDWNDATSDALYDGSNVYQAPIDLPQYKHPNKKWRIKQGSTPNWYKARAGIKTQAQSGAARVARFRPQKSN